MKANEILAIGNEIFRPAKENQFIAKKSLQSVKRTKRKRICV